MRYGYWLPVFGGWLRNVADEQMEASWDYVKRLAIRSEQIGFDLTLIAEPNLNDIKGPEAPALDAWSTAAALAAVTSSLELMVAVRPTFHEPALFAKQAANIDRISGPVSHPRPTIYAGGENVQQDARGYQNYQQWLANTKLEQQISLEDYSVSNRGLRAGLVGTPEQVRERVAQLEDAGVDLLLLQCSPQLEEMERFAAQVIDKTLAARC